MLGPLLTTVWRTQWEADDVGANSKHEELEQNLAKFVGKQDAFLLNFGYQGMGVNLIDAVCGRNDVIVYDSEAHACILDGVRLHMGNVLYMHHNNMDSLRNMLVKANRLAGLAVGYSGN